MRRAALPFAIWLDSRGTTRNFKNKNLKSRMSVRARADKATNNPTKNRLKRRITGRTQIRKVERTFSAKTDAEVTPRKQANEIVDNAKDNMYG